MRPSSNRERRDRGTSSARVAGSIIDAGGAGNALACVDGKTYQSASAP
jgi:hypothetical protein